MTSKQPRYLKFILVAAILLTAFSFRTAITSVPPVLEVIQADIGLSYTVVSLLTTIPTLCFGVFAFAAAPVTRYLGRERALFWAMVLLGAGTLVRIWGLNAAVLVLTTVFVGAGIAISQTLLPSIISKYLSDSAALTTGLYTAALTVGAGAASGLTPTIASALGSWQQALAVWGLPALAAAVIWIPVTGGPDESPEPEQSRLPWSEPLAWLLAVFFGLQALLFYTTITWLSPLYVALGWTPTEAGYLLVVVFVGQLGGTLGIAPLSDRWTDRRPWIGLALLCCCAGFAAITFAPQSQPWLWALVLGVGLGGIFAFSMTLPIDFTATPSAADGLTAMMVGIGYFIAAGGPFLGGLVRDFSGGYRLTFVAMLLVSISLLVIVVRLHPDQNVA